MTDMNEEKDRQDLEKETEPLPAEKPEEAPAPEKEEKKPEKKEKKLGVKKIESLGKTFDPNLHNAVMHVDDESLGENTIVDVFQEGFQLGDKVIRFAMVKVAN